MTDINQVIDIDDYKKYKSTDPEYYKLYMRKRYKEVVSQKVECENCKCFIVSRHKKTKKCLGNNYKGGVKDSVVDKYIDRTSNIDRIEQLERMVELLTIKCQI